MGSTLMQAALTKENLKQAFKRVRANKGAAGVDGLDINQTARQLVTKWPTIREQLLRGTYRPLPVRRGGIPKPDADDANVYVRSKRAGERVMQWLRRAYSKLHLRINETKSAVAHAWTRTFLGYSFWVAEGRDHRSPPIPIAAFIPRQARGTASAARPGGAAGTAGGIRPRSRVAAHRR